MQEPPDRLTIHYRGPLSSCNYTCTYCPFAKEWESAEVLAADRAGLARFVAWVEDQTQRIEILFTPWGEALVRPWYREALKTISLLPHVTRVAAQTNLSMALDWVADCHIETLGFWTTWHPTQVSMSRFTEQARVLDGLGVGYSVGVVGLKENLDAIEDLRQQLPEHVYLWVNRYQREPHYYDPSEINRIEAIDPHFWRNTEYPSRGQDCWAGETHFTVDGEGDVRRCHFDKGVLGNLYRDELQDMLRPRPCAMSSCRCHIGTVFLKSTQQHAVYGPGLMERRPATT